MMKMIIYLPSSMGERQVYPIILSLMSQSCSLNLSANYFLWAVYCEACNLIFFFSLPKPWHAVLFRLCYGKIVKQELGLKCTNSYVSSAEEILGVFMCWYLTCSFREHYLIFLLFVATVCLSRSRPLFIKFNLI